MLPQHLIERALSLTGKTMEDMNTWKIIESTKFEGIERGRYQEFSIEKFCYYLISEEFTDKYRTHCDEFNLNPEMDFLYAIRDYQSGNEEPLVKLLSKI